jgi:hypothetical protein
VGVCFTRGMDSVSLPPDEYWQDAFGRVTSHGRSPDGRSCRPLAVLMRFDELKVEDARRWRFISESETGAPELLADGLLAASGKGGRMAGHTRHSTHGEAAPGDGRGRMGEWSGRGPAPQLGPGALRYVWGNPGLARERRTVV